MNKKSCPYKTEVTALAAWHCRWRLLCASLEDKGHVCLGHACGLWHLAHARHTVTSTEVYTNQPLSDTDRLPMFSFGLLCPVEQG